MRKILDDFHTEISNQRNLSHWLQLKMNGNQNQKVLKQFRECN